MAQQNRSYYAGLEFDETESESDWEHNDGEEDEANREMMEAQRTHLIRLATNLGAENMDSNEDALNLNFACVIAEFAINILLLWICHRNNSEELELKVLECIVGVLRYCDAFWSYRTRTMLPRTRRTASDAQRRLPFDADEQQRQSEIAEFANSEDESW